MKTTVYAIGISTTTAVKKELKKERETYAKLKKAGGSKTQRLKSAFKILELTLAWCEELDESEVVEDVDLDESSKSLKRALERANNYTPMLARPAFRDSTLPTECLETLIAGYQRLEMYAEALVASESLVEWERKRNDKVDLQSALRQIANLYFQRGQSSQAKANDFARAMIYYEEESTILRDMNASDFDEPTTLDELHQSSQFNLGCMLGRTGQYKEAEQFLYAAKVRAKALKDMAKLKDAILEMADIYRRQRTWDKVLGEQKKELRIIEKYPDSFKDDRVPCLSEMAKTYFLLEDYSECLNVCNQITVCEEEGDPSGESLAHAFVKLIAKKREVEALPDRQDLSTIFERAYNHYTSAKILRELGLYHTAFTAVLKADSAACSQAEARQQMSVFRIRLMHLKADIWWDMRTAQYLEYKKLNEYIIRLSEEVYDKEEAEMYAQWILTYRRLIKAAYYFDMKEDHQAYKETFRMAEREYKDLRPAYERMDVDEWNEEEEAMLVEDDPFDKAEVSTMVFRVLFGVDGRDETLEISSDNPLVKGQWLMERVQELAWSRFGIKPLNLDVSISAIPVNPDDFILAVLSNAKQLFRARCLGIDYQSYAEQYQQVCKILQRELNGTILEALEGQSLGKLSLVGLALDSNDIPIVIHLLRRSPPLSELDLSANLLRDSDVLSLFTHVPLPARLWLHSNRLTSQCLDHLFMCELGQLQELGLAYNPLGPDTPRRLINMLATSPHLKRVAFDGGMITGDDPASLAELREKAAQAHVSLVCNELSAL